MNSGYNIIKQLLSNIIVTQYCNQYYVLWREKKSRMMFKGWVVWEYGIPLLINNQNTIRSYDCTC